MSAILVFFVLDTNVASAYIRSLADPKVGEWFAQNPITNMYLTSVSVAELWRGAYRLEHGRKRRQLSERIGEVLHAFSGRILPFDEKSALEYARLVDIRRRKGLGVSELDAMIAAIANSNDMTVVTGDKKHFSGMGINVVNPWK